MIIVRTPEEWGCGKAAPISQYVHCGGLTLLFSYNPMLDTNVFVRAWVEITRNVAGCIDRVITCSHVPVDENAIVNVKSSIRSKLGVWLYAHTKDYEVDGNLAAIV